MEISATFEGSAVTIVNVDVDGSTYYLTYKDSSDNLIVARRPFTTATNPTITVATSATGS